MKVLIFKVNQLGDNVVFLPVVQEMRRRFPSWELAVFTSPTAASLYAGDIAAERLTVTPTRTFNGSWKRPWQLAKLWRQAAGFAPDACLLSDDQANVAYLLACLSGSAVRVGVRRNFIRLGFLATALLPDVPDERVALTNWRIAGALVEALGGKGWPATPPPPDLTHLLTTEAPVAGDRPRIVIHRGAARAYQRWLPERYVALANRLQAEGRWQVDWIETPDWSPAGLSGQVNRVQTRNLGDLVRCVSGAALYVGNNTGPMHIANALGRRCVIINGPTRPSWDPAWYPERMLMLRDMTLPCLPCDTTDRQAEFCRNFANPMACMTFWSVDAIYERCLDILDNGIAMARVP